MRDIDAAMARNRPTIDGPTDDMTDELRQRLGQAIDAESSASSGGFGSEPRILGAEMPHQRTAQPAGPRRRRSTVLATAATVVVVGGLLSIAWYSAKRPNDRRDVTVAATAATTSPPATTTEPVAAEPANTGFTEEPEVIETTTSVVPVPRVLPPPIELWANQWINSTGLMTNFENDEITMGRIGEACSVDLSDREVNDDLARKYIEADGGDAADPDLVLRAAQSVWLAARNICPSQFPPDVIGAGPPGDFGSIADELKAARVADEAIRDAVMGSSDGPLIAESVPIASLPSIGVCDAGLPNYGAKIRRDFVRYESAAEVLQELVSRTDLDVGIPLPQHGYLEMQFGDGSVFYGTSGFEIVFGVLVHVIPFEDAWALQSWETSGC